MHFFREKKIYANDIKNNSPWHGASPASLEAANKTTICFETLWFVKQLTRGRNEPDIVPLINSMLDKKLCSLSLH